MNATSGVLFKEFGNRAVFPERFQQFHFGVGQFNKDNAHAMCGLVLRFGHFCAKGSTIGGNTGFHIRHSNSDVVETTNHFLASFLYPACQSQAVLRAVW